jgi:hypothetical protein
VDQQACGINPYADVYVALKAIEPGARAVPPGTQGAIYRTLDFLRSRRDGEALARLERIAHLVETLWRCARSGDEAVRSSAHCELALLGDQWLAAAPMFAPAPPAHATAVAIIS